MSRLVLVAVTHRNAPLPVLERVALDTASAGAVAAVLRAMRGVDEAVVLASCERTELYVVGGIVDDGIWVETLSILTGAPLQAVRSFATVAAGGDASLHLFRVAAGLESRVTGDRGALDDVRAAVTAGLASGTAGRSLASLFRWAEAAARRAQRAGGTVPSLAQTALDAVGSRKDPELPVLVIGAGRMAAAVTATLARDLVAYRVCARRTEAAARLTRRASHAVHLDDLPAELAAAELVVCATGADTPTVTAPAVAAAMAGRDGRRLTILDLSMPRNVDPACATVPGVTLCGLDNLTADRGDGASARRAQAVIATHAAYVSSLERRARRQLVTALHERIEAVCRAEAVRALGPGPVAEHLARSITETLLRGPALHVDVLQASADVAGLAALASALGVDVAPGAGPVARERRLTARQPVVGS